MLAGLAFPVGYKALHAGSISCVPLDGQFLRVFLNKANILLADRHKEALPCEERRHAQGATKTQDAHFSLAR